MSIVVNAGSAGAILQMAVVSFPFAACPAANAAWNDSRPPFANRWQFKYNKYAFHFHLQTHLSAIYLCMYSALLSALKRCKKLEVEDNVPSLNLGQRQLQWRVVDYEIPRMQ